MNNNSKLVESVIIAVAIIVLGFCLKSGIEKFADKDRVVNVKGLSEVEVPANKVTWPIVFKSVGNDLPQLYVSINNTTNAILKYLRSNGLSD